MKIKEGFVLRQVAGQWMAVPIGRMTEKVRGVIALNDTAADIWKILQEDHTEQEVTDILRQNYDPDDGELEESVKEFIRTLETSGILIR